MIANINSLISSVAANKPADKSENQRGEGDDFAATLEKASPQKAIVAAKHSKALSAEKGKKDKTDTTKTDEVKNTGTEKHTQPVALSVNISPVKPVKETDTINDPQLQALQQLVAQNAQSAVPIASPVAPQSVILPNLTPQLTTSQVNKLKAESALPVALNPEQNTENLALSLAVMPTEDNQERQNQLFLLDEDSKPKPVAEMVRSSLDGRQNTAKTEVEIPNTLIDIMNKTTADIKETTRIQQNAGIVPPHFPVQGTSSLQATDVGQSMPIAIAHEITTVQATTAVASAAVLNQPLGNPAWQQALGQQLSYFSRNNIHNAEIRLHPEELGSLQINLRLNNDQAQLHFVTGNHQVRAALEAAMPHLRTSLAESGINLGESGVGSNASFSWNMFSQSGSSSHRHPVDEDAQEATHPTEENCEVITNTIHYSNRINTFV